MRRFTTFVALLFLLSTAAPVLACVTGGTMSHAEHDCCAAMHGNCGKMAKTGCCKSEVRTDENPQIAAKSLSMELHWAVIAWVSSVSTSVGVLQPTLLHTPDQHSPPGLLITKNTVLRV
jgi:hypothetical protein